MSVEFAVLKLPESQMAYAGQYIEAFKEIGKQSRFRWLMILPMESELLMGTAAKETLLRYRTEIDRLLGESPGEFIEALKQRGRMKACLYCGATFEAKRKDKIYCSGKCKRMANYYKKQAA